MDMLALRPTTAARLAHASRRMGRDEVAVANDAIEDYLDQLERRAPADGAPAAGLLARIHEFHRLHPGAAMDGDAGALVSAMRDEDQH